MARLSRSYEKCKDVVAYHLNEILKMPVLGQNQKDIQTALKYIDDDATGLSLAKCTNAHQLIAAYMDGRFNTTLRIAWRTKSAKLDEPPDLKLMREFLKEQEEIVANTLVAITISHISPREDTLRGDLPLHLHLKGIRLHLLQRRSSKQPRAGLASTARVLTQLFPAQISRRSLQLRDRTG